MKILLYGLGKGLDLVEKKIRKEHTIIGYMDSCSELSFFRKKPFYKLEELNCKNLFDYIIITIQDRKTSWEVFEMLVDLYRVASGRVIPFYAYANYEMYDIRMKEYGSREIQGLIFGNSHAKCGFLEDELSFPFLNLSISSQDIYYNYKTFQSCIRRYGDRLKQLKYIIIDLYDYYCFNLDTSMTSYAIDYICWGGYLDEHNFEFNHNFGKTFREELFDVSYILDKPSVLYKLFKDIDVKQNELQALSRWKHIDKKNKFITAGPIIASSVLRKSENTIAENRELLDSFLKDIKDFDPDIKIIFTLIPRYIEMELATKSVMKFWKREFEKIISSLCMKYHAFFWNYKNLQNISGNYMFYYDVEHLNTVGARALTALLEQDLKTI